MARASAVGSYLPYEEYECCITAIPKQPKQCLTQGLGTYKNPTTYYYFRPIKTRTLQM